MQSAIVVLKPVYLKFKMLLIKVIPVPEDRLRNFRIYVNDIFAFTFHKQRDESWVAINPTGDAFEVVNKYENGFIKQVEHTVIDNFFPEIAVAEYA